MNTGVISRAQKCLLFNCSFRAWFTVPAAHKCSFSHIVRLCMFSFCIRNMSVQSSGSCFIRMTEGMRGVRLSSRRRTYSLNWDESTPPPQEPTISNPRCCNRSRTCEDNKTGIYLGARQVHWPHKHTKDVFQSSILTHSRMKAMVSRQKIKLFLAGPVTCAQHAQGPGFDPQDNKQTRKYFKGLLYPKCCLIKCCLISKSNANSVQCCRALGKASASSPQGRHTSRARCQKTVTHWPQPGLWGAEQILSTLS